jgi:hypothetical protein
MSNGLSKRLSRLEQRPVQVCNCNQSLERRDTEISIRMLQRICWYTRAFQPSRIFYLKTLHNKVMTLVESKLAVDEIGRQMMLNNSDGRNLSLLEQLWDRDWWGNQEPIIGMPVHIVQDLREGLENYPSMLEHLDRALSKSIREVPVDQPTRVPYHLIGELGGPGVINAPFCHF